MKLHPGSGNPLKRKVICGVCGHAMAAGQPKERLLPLRHKKAKYWF